MAYDTHANLAYSTILTPPSPAISGTSFVVQSGDGAKFGSGALTFNATVWPANVQPTTANAEIVRVTNIATDTFAITRAQESTSARTIVAGDQIAMTITKKTITDLEAVAAGLAASKIAIGNGVGAALVALSGTSGGVVGFTAADVAASSGVLASTALVLGGGAGATPATDSNWTIEQTAHSLVSATQPRCQVFNASAQSINNATDTALTFDSEDHDVGAMHSTSSNPSRITVPAGAGGTYLIVGATTFAAGTGDSFIYVKKNGTTVVGTEGRGQLAAGGLIGINVVCLVVLAAADYVELIANQSSGGALNVGNASRVASAQFGTTKLW